MGFYKYNIYKLYFAMLLSHELVLRSVTSRDMYKMEWLCRTRRILWCCHKCL